MTKIIECKIENILGAESVEFAPNGQSITIGGANGEGKSSAIWALIMALGGKDKIPERPLKDGSEFGSVEIQLEKFKVTLEVGQDRKSKLRVESSEGARFASPQAMLDGLFKGLSFDPGLFKSMDSANRLETLRNLVGLDLSDLKEEFEKIYIERRDIGRDVKALQVQLSLSLFHPDVPEIEIDVAQKLNELKEVQETSQGFKDLAEESRRIKGQAITIAEKQRVRLATIEEYQSRINNLKSEIEEDDAKRKNLFEEADLIGRKLCDPKVIEIENRAIILYEEIRQADGINAKIRTNKEHSILKKQFEAITAEQNHRTKKLESIQRAKIARLQSVKFPIDGLTIDEDQILFNGIPFDQLSESEQWEVSTAIGFALNPQGIMFMKNCGGLDRKSRDRVRARAAANGVQLFLEVVDDADDVQILISEGKVKENRL